MSPKFHTLLKTVRSWMTALRCQSVYGEEPGFIPLTKEEIRIARDEHNMNVGFRSGDWDNINIYGTPVFDTAYGVEMRRRQLTMPLFRLAEKVDIHPLDLTLHQEMNPETLYLRRRLEAHIVADVTRLDIALEWDIWAKLKRKLRVTKWFPIKHRVVAIDGRVLYPYLTVNLPHNRHHVQFAIVPV